MSKTTLIKNLETVFLPEKTIHQSLRGNVLYTTNADKPVLIGCALVCVRRLNTGQIFSHSALNHLRIGSNEIKHEKVELVKF